MTGYARVQTLFPDDGTHPMEEPLEPRLGLSLVVDELHLHRFHRRHSQNRLAESSALKEHAV